MRPDTESMDYVHHCVFCGWSRPGASPTILSPGCERCGCALRSSPASEFSAQQEQAAPAAPPVSPGLIRLAAVTIGALVIVAAIAAGWREGGIWIAVVGLGLGGLASLSLPYPTGR
jgi:hypothetical protein